MGGFRARENGRRAAEARRSVTDALEEVANQIGTGVARLREIPRITVRVPHGTRTTGIARAVNRAIGRSGRSNGGGGPE